MGTTHMSAAMCGDAKKQQQKIVREYAEFAN